jgi:hypothetical protein
VVEGEKFGRYYLPHASGVAFSRNLYRWSPQILKEDGFLRLVWGLGTRAVDQVNDYPRLVALSHPLLRPENSPIAIRRYSQQYVDLIDLNVNEFKTLPVSQVLAPDYPVLRYIAQVEEEGYIASIHSRLIDVPPERLVVTFDELFQRTPLANRMRTMLQILEKHYRGPVDTEFTVEIEDPFSPTPNVYITLLQCRPQSQIREVAARLPQTLYAQDIIFSTRRLVPEGVIQGIQVVIFVSPEGYFSLSTPSARSGVGRAVSRLNARLDGQTFICVGPGRWGTNNPDLGVNVGYSDIYHTRALVELSGLGVCPELEPSFGTHFFQDLVEANIYPLAVDLDDSDAIFNRNFFYQTPNHLAEISPEDAGLAETVRLINVSDYRSGCHIDLVMDNEQGRAVAFLASDAEVQ